MADYAPTFLPDTNANAQLNFVVGTKKPYSKTNGNPNYKTYYSNKSSSPNHNHYEVTPLHWHDTPTRALVEASLAASVSITFLVERGIVISGYRDLFTALNPLVGINYLITPEVVKILYL